MSKRGYNPDESEEYNHDYSTGNYTKINELFDSSRIENTDEDNEDNEDLDLIDEDLEYDDNEENLDELLADEPKSVQPKKTFTNIKPKLMGKHSLAHDNIFKGKKTDTNKEPEEEYIIKNVSVSLEIGEDTIQYSESRNSHEQQHNLQLQQDIYNCLKSTTDLKFIGSRRKPSTYDLNNYFKILITDLKPNGYSHTEIFAELSLYFSDNIWSIFTILNNNYKDIIIAELTEKYGMEGLDKVNFF